MRPEASPCDPEQGLFGANGPSQEGNDPRGIKIVASAQFIARREVPHTYKSMYAPPSAIALTHSIGILFPRVAPASSRQWKVPPRWQRYALRKSRCAAGVPPAPEPPRWRRYAPRPAMSGHMMMRHPNVPGHPNVVRAVREPPLHWAIRHPLLAKSCGRAQMTSSVRTSGTFSFNPQPDVGSCRCAGHCRR